MRRAVAVFMLAAVAVGCSSTSAPKGDAALQPLLRPHDTVYRPEGAGPFPAVILLHGCLGVRGKEGRWAERLREAGYVALVVDSMTGRGITTRDDLARVCRGLTLWGGTRAADVRASLAYVRTLPFVDPSRMAAVGFSHGAWAALDFLSSASPDEVHGLRAVIGFYPYCGVASRARWFGWDVQVPTLLLLAGQDVVVSPAHCKSVAERVAAHGQPVTVTTYPDARHSFDWRASDETEDAQRRVAAFLAEHLVPRTGPRAEAAR
jgi:dienelactone hydrolase